MDYDARISQLATAIKKMHDQKSVANFCPAPIDDSAWNNSSAKTAAEQLFSNLDKNLAYYQDSYDQCLQALQSRKELLKQIRVEQFLHYSSLLSGMTAEDRVNYIDKEDMDASVKKLLL